MNKLTVRELMGKFASSGYYGTTKQFQEFMILLLTKMKYMEEELEELKKK